MQGKISDGQGTQLGIDDAARAWERHQVQAALAGDAAAVRAIVQQYRRGMFGLALRTVGDRAEAEDVVQEALAKAFRRLDQFDWSYRLSTWLYRIVLNCCRDHLKSPRRLERPAGLSRGDVAASGNFGEADPCILRERNEQLLSALAKLGPQHNEIIVLKHLMELSFQEIHELTGTPITGLKIRAVRARQQLRAILEEQME